MATPYDQYTHTPYNPSAQNYSAFMQQSFNPSLQIGQTGSAIAPTRTSTTPAPAPSGYTPNPAPQAGSGTAYGRVPGNTPVPPSTFTQTAGVYPGLARQAGQISSNVLSELEGALSPETMDSINQHAAEFGVTSGMPLSGFAANQGLRSLGLNVEATQHQGLQDYLSSLSGIGNAQLPPALLAQISGHNAELAAAPDPQMAAQQMIKNYQNAMRGYGGATFQNPSGGTGLYTNPSPFTTQDANLQDAPALASTGGATMVGGVPYYGGQDVPGGQSYPQFDPTQAYSPNAGTGDDVNPYPDFYNIQSFTPNP